MWERCGRLGSRQGLEPLTGGRGRVSGVGGAPCCAAGQAEQARTGPSQAAIAGPAHLRKPFCARIPLVRTLVLAALMAALVPCAYADPIVKLLYVSGLPRSGGLHPAAHL